MLLHHARILSMVNVEIIYISEQGTFFQQELQVPVGAIIETVLVESGIHQQFPETHDYDVGIFGHIVNKHTIVTVGDRIEVYRPLLMSPEENRKRKAKKQR